MGRQRPAHAQPRLQRKWLDDFTALGMREPQDELGDADRQKARAAASVAPEIAGRSASASSSISKICLRTASNLSSTVSLKSGFLRLVNLEAISAESGKKSGVLCGSEQRRGWLKDRVEGQRRQVGLVPEPLS